MLYFQDKNGTDIAKIVASGNSFAPDQILEDDEEIIGVYGTKDQRSDGIFDSMGFIVWKPPNY